MGPPKGPHLKLSIVIPTYNGAARVGDLLGILAGCRLEADASEVVVVDNRSTDGTAGTLRKDARSSALTARGVRVRVVEEPTPGASRARIRGLRESAAPVACLMDDDVVPCPEFFALGLAEFADPRVGAVIPRISPRYEVPAPPAVARREHLLALNHRLLGERRLEWAGPDPALAPTLTAGLFVHRESLLRQVDLKGEQRMLPGRTGTALACSEDIELGVLIRRAGRSVVYQPALDLGHRIPPRRFETRYFAALIAGVVRSEMTLRRIYGSGPSPEDRPVRNWLRLGTALAALPVLLTRPDGWREACFVLADRWARIQGPYQDLLARADSPRPGGDRSS